DKCARFLSRSSMILWRGFEGRGTMAGISSKTTPAGGSPDRAMASEFRIGPLGEAGAGGGQPEAPAPGGQPQTPGGDRAPGAPGQNRRPDFQGARRALACTALSAWASEAAIGCYSGHDKDQS